jgi:hypothetical protein
MWGFKGAVEAIRFECAEEPVLWSELGEGQIDESDIRSDALLERKFLRWQERLLKKHGEQAGKFVEDRYRQWWASYIELGGR